MYYVMKAIKRLLDILHDLWLDLVLFAAAGR